jgi:salicyloyl-CoA 5-hydroxylase
MSLRIACVGGGPGGLFLATLVKTADPSAEVTVFERNRADDTFGFGVVFSDATLAGIHDADPVLRRALDEYGVHWDRIEVRLKGERRGCAGNGMSAILRKRLLALLQQRARDVGVDLRFETEVELADLDGYDLVVAADGANSRIREQLAAHLRPTAETASAKFIWFGTTYQFEGLTFVHERGPDGVFAVHGYPIGEGLSTFIVETDEASWRRAGLDEFDVTQPPGPSDLKSKDYLEKLFAEQIDGHPLVDNNSRWGNFRTRRAGRWHHGRVALLGDAAHTAHFSVGSGTKMAMEDAVALSAALTAHAGDVPGALAAYEAGARPSVDRIQGSARPSLSWWEHFGEYHDALEPWQFTFHFISRSITADRIARRDPAFVEDALEQWHAVTGATPLAASITIGGVEWPGRMVRVDQQADGQTTSVLGDGGQALRLMAAVPRGDEGSAWGLWLHAPSEEGHLPAASAVLHEAVAAGASLVAVHGGTPLTRTRLCEESRMALGCPSLLVDPALDRDAAQTVLLAGRADLVAAGAPGRAVSQ